MNNRNFQYIEYAGPATGTAPVPASPNLDLSPTWAAGDRYCVIAMSAVSDFPGVFDVILEINGVISFDHYISARDFTNDVYSCPMIFAFNVLTGTELLQLYVDSDATAPDPGATIKQAGIYVFKMLENDQGNPITPTAGSSTTSTSFVDVTDATVTIAKTGDYLILANATVGKDETTANFDIRLAHTVAGPSTTGYGQQSMRANSVTKFFPWAHMRKLSLTAGDVLTIQHKVTTTGTATTTYASIVALYLDDFPNALVIEDTADASQNTADTNWHDHGNMATDYRLRAFDALVLSCGQYRRGAGSVDASMQTLYDGTTIQETRNESVIANGEATHFCAKALDPATAGDHTVTQQIKNHGTGITSAFISDGCTAIIGMANNTTTIIRGGEVYGGEVY